MIRREIGDDQICVLTFDRPESGANIFDAATLEELNEHLDFVEHEASLRGLIIASAKKSTTTALRVASMTAPKRTNCSSAAIARVGV